MSDERREQLLAVGLEAFGKTPYGDVSLEQVARRAGVSYGLLYHYFADKRRFYLETLRHSAKLIGQVTAPDPGLKPVERLYAGLRAYLDFVEEHPLAYQAFITGGNAGDLEVQEILEEAHWNGLRHVLDALEIEDLQPRLRILLRGWASFNEGATIEWLKRRDIDREELVDLLAQSFVVLAGIADVPGQGN